MGFFFASYRTFKRWGTCKVNDLRVDFFFYIRVLLLLVHSDALRQHGRRFPALCLADNSARLSYSLPPRPPCCDSGSKSGEIKVSGHIGSTHLGLAEREMRGPALGRPPVEGHISQKSSDVCVYRGADRSTGSGGGGKKKAEHISQQDPRRPPYLLGKDKKK